MAPTLEDAQPLLTALERMAVTGARCDAEMERSRCLRSMLSSASA